MKEFFIDKNADGSTLEKYVKKMLPNAPLSFIYKVFRQRVMSANFWRLIKIPSLSM